MNWQPIETAPHATEVLLYLPAAGIFRERVEVGFASWGTVRGQYSNRSYASGATHWMPLPPPPEKE